MRTKKEESNVEKEKLDIIKWVTGLKDKDAIEKLRMLRDSPKKSDWWNEIAEEEKTAIDKGIEDIRAGRVKPHKEAKKLYAKWL
jgi:predicted transcriptional regulator